MMKYAEGVWEARDCPPNMNTGLVWRQDLCACGEELVAVDPNDWCAGMGFYSHNENKHKYVRVSVMNVLEQSNYLNLSILIYLYTYIHISIL